MFLPNREQLDGLSYEWAHLYGMPHLGAHYTRPSINSHEMNEGAWCAACGRPATNVHHVVPRSKGKFFKLKTPVGQFILLPPLFALCGSGTTGCHGQMHNGIHVSWVWDFEEAAHDWWSGYFLSHGVEPNSSELFDYGHYEINGKPWTLADYETL